MGVYKKIARARAKARAFAGVRDAMICSDLDAAAEVFNESRLTLSDALFVTAMAGGSLVRGRVRSKPGRQLYFAVSQDGDTPLWASMILMAANQSYENLATTVDLVCEQGPGEVGNMIGHMVAVGHRVFGAKLRLDDGGD